MGEVLHLFKCLVHRFPMEEVDEVEVVPNKGFRGCIHGRPGSKRQVSLIDRETLEKLFDRVEFVGRTPDNPYALEKALTVFICHGSKFGTMADLWPKVKRWR